MTIERLVCRHGGHAWERERKPGRRPIVCPEHRTAQRSESNRHWRAAAAKRGPETAHERRLRRWKSLHRLWWIECEVYAELERRASVFPSLDSLEVGALFGQENSGFRVMAGFTLDELTEVAMTRAHREVDAMVLEGLAPEDDPGRLLRAALGDDVEPYRGPEPDVLGPFWSRVPTPVPVARDGHSTCLVNGCELARIGNWPYCAEHRRNERVNGDPRIPARVSFVGCMRNPQ